MRAGSPARRRRIRAVARQIQVLSDELESLLLEEDPQDPPSPPLRTTTPPPPPRSLNPDSTGFFLPDDRVEIVNNLNGLRGQQGIVLYTNRRFVYFRLDTTGDTIWRAPRNLRRLDPPS